MHFFSVLPPEINSRMFLCGVGAEVEAAGLGWAGG